MSAVKCLVRVTAGVIPNIPDSRLTREWDFTQEDFDGPPAYIDRTGAAMNYAMSLQNPQQRNWVKLEWIWM